MTANRIVLLDAIRGLGVLGILLCNIPDFAAAPSTAESLPLWPYGHSAASTGLWLVTQIFFREKFITLFAMLFGPSICSTMAWQDWRRCGAAPGRRAGC